MRFSLAIETSAGVENRVDLIVRFSERLTDYFSQKNYGNDVKEIVIGTICVAPEFDSFSKIRKPRYIDYRKYINRDGREMTEDKVFIFDLKLDYEDFKNQTDDENERMLGSEIFASLTNLDALPKKVKHFDKDRLKEHFLEFLRETEIKPT